MESIYKLMDELISQFIEEGTALFPADYRLNFMSFDSILQECRTERRIYLNYMMADPTGDGIDLQARG